MYHTYIFINFPEKMQNFLNVRFLENGIKIVIINDSGILDNYIGKKKKETLKDQKIILLAYINKLHSVWVEKLFDIRKNFEVKECDFLIITQDKLDSNFIQTMLFLDVVKIIEGNIEYNLIYNQIHNVIKSIGSQDPREYTRISPSNKDYLRCTMYVKGKEILSKVLNISVVGIGVEIYKIRDFIFFEKDQIIEQCQLYINSKIVTVGLQVMVLSKKNLLVGAKFYNPNYLFLVTLSQYLLKQISFEEISN